MCAIKSNWSSVTNTCGSFSGLRTKLRNLLTTCFHKHQQKQQQQHTIFLQSFQSHDYYNSNYLSREFAQILAQPTYVKNQKRWLLAPAAFNQLIEIGGCHTISPKILSSTPRTTIATNSAANTIENVNCETPPRIRNANVLISAYNSSASSNINNNMTILDNTFEQAREEYPDLDAEIRAILMARAQDGATILDIKTDYRKNTGLPFPIYQNITSFLLTIPMVTAICSERGTQYFNIMPTSKTQHLYNLVMEQNSQQQQQQQPQQTQQYTRNWRYHAYRKERNCNFDNNNNKINYNYNNNNLNNQYYNNEQNNKELKQQQLQHQTPVNQPHDEEVRNEQFEQIKQLMIKDKNLKDGWESVCNGDANYYQDNCNHLYSRIYNQQTPVSSMPPTTELNEMLYNNNSTPVQNDWISQTHEQHNKLNNEEQQGQQQQQPVQSQHEVATVKGKELITECVNIMDYQQPVAKRRRFNAPKIWPYCSAGNSGSGSIGRYTSTSYAKSSQWSDSCYISCDSQYEAHLYDFPLLGDDFFLYLARMELNCKFKKNESVYQAGLCISGQTIRAAINRVRRLADREQRIIVNIGSVDIMRGRTLLQIEHDYRELINVMHKKGLTPILTTLAPLANYMHVNELRQTWERFNEFIKRIGQCLLVIDIWSCLTNKRGQTLFDCYQKGPRHVTGAKEPYVFWNKIGRQRVLKNIMLNIEY